MQIAQIIGGYSLGAADLLRRAMGKKLPEEMAQQRTAFVAGAAKNDVGARKAHELFDLMEKFAGYGFNRSHAAAYALVAYQTAYFKAHYPAAFLAANMSAIMNDTDKVKVFVDDALAPAHGLTLRPPDINDSNYRFEPVDAKTIRYGLGAIKGTGEAAITSIVSARKEGGPFKDLFDFCHRVDKRLVNRRVVESLIRAGAFDPVDDHRASLLASVGVALESAEQASRSAHQVSLFGDLAESAHRPALTPAQRWGAKERLQHEKLALGFYFSGHPFNIHREEVRRFVQRRIADIAAMPAGDFSSRGQKYWIAGVVMNLRLTNTANGRMAIVMLADDSEPNEIVFFGEAFDKFRQKLREDELLVMQVELRSRGGGRGANGEYEEARTSIRAVDVLDLAEARNHFAHGMTITCNGGSEGSKLRDLLTPYRSGRCPVSVVYSNSGASCEISLGDAWRVNLHDDLIQSLHAWLKPENVKIVYEVRAEQ
jgi:DNA polymerase-3 subunit alpha